MNYIRLSALRNNEFSQFLENVLSALHRYTPATLQIKEEHDQLEVISDLIKNLLNPQTGNAITSELTQLDARRGNALNGILSLINGFSYSTDPATQAAAHLLDTHLHKFGSGIARDSLQSETSKLQKIVLDWNTHADLKAALTHLGLDSWKTELETANTTFDTRYVDRAVDNGTANTDRVSAKRPEANQAYFTLMEKLEASWVMNKKTAPWTTAIAAVNGVIDDYNVLLAAHKSSHNDHKKDDGNGAGTPDKLQAPDV